MCVKFVYKSFEKYVKINKTPNCFEKTILQKGHEDANSISIQDITN